MAHTAVWTARCKSGFEYQGKDGGLHVCGKVCGRGKLLCEDCERAVVVEGLCMEQPGVVARLAMLWAVVVVWAHHSGQDSVGRTVGVQ